MTFMHHFTRADIDEFMYNTFVVVNGADPPPGVGQPASKLDVFFAGCVVRFEYRSSLMAVYTFLELRLLLR